MKETKEGITSIKISTSSNSSTIVVVVISKITTIMTEIKIEVGTMRIRILPIGDNNLISIK